ncbi:hypothetical protein ACFL20_00175 [Spirochaetota bacterium]
MKNRIIRINKISDIDTSKVSVYDMNNRYLDNDGNIYGLKYDKVQKKIDIIKLVRTHNSDVTSMQQKIIQRKSEDNVALDIEDNNEFLERGDENTTYTKDVNHFISSTISNISTHKERLIGIIMNIKNSKAFPKENKAESVTLDDIFRSIEIDAIQKFDEFENYHRELTSYPRSVSYYQAKMDQSARDIIEKLFDKQSKVMKFIYYYEMINSIDDVYQNVYKLLINLKQFIDNKKTDEKKAYGTTEHQFLNDAKTSLTNTIEEIEKLIGYIVKHKEKIMDISSY